MKGWLESSRPAGKRAYGGHLAGQVLDLDLRTGNAVLDQADDVVGLHRHGALSYQAALFI